MSLIEVLCVALILAILAAILTPVFSRAKIESRASAAGLNLKGFWQGLILYQSDNEVRVDYGPLEQMGLPPAHSGWMSFVNNYTGDHHDGWTTKSAFLPCGRQHGGMFNGMGLDYMGNNLSDWPNDVESLRENTAVIVDPNCNFGPVAGISQKTMKRSIAVTLGGQVKDRTRREFTIWDQRFYQ